MPAIVARYADNDQPTDIIDPQELLSKNSLDELNVAAENYFARLTTWDDHLAKPFNTAADAPAQLINFAVMIQGLNLVPGLRVLDFGAGTGWTSRYLTQLGCSTILLDVSATAMAMAAELYRCQPVFGDQPQPKFLVYDGTRIDLPDGSVDRILCFDAFHHAPNVSQVLEEFGRILAPGGIAAFSEPGPNHSLTARSQAEMRTYGVLENDLDIHAIWRVAKEVGFERIRVAAFNVPAYHLGLEEFDQLLTGGAPYLRWAESTRHFLHDVRDFFLTKTGTERVDSRYRRGLAAAIEVMVAPVVTSGTAILAKATVRNVGEAVWLSWEVALGGVSLGCHLYGNGDLLAFEYHWERLSRLPLYPGDAVELEFELPALAPGKYAIEFDCVADRICWFAEVGSRAVRIDIESRL